MSLKKSVSKQDQELVLIKETKAIARLPIQSKYAGGADISIRLINFYTDKNDLWQGLKATNPNMSRVVARQRLMQLTDEQLAAVEAECLAAYEVESASPARARTLTGC